MIIFSGSFLLAMSQLLWIEQAGFNVLIFCFVGLFAVFLLRKKHCKYHPEAAVWKITE